MIRIIGIDPSTSNWGMCRALVDLDNLDIEIEDLILIKTESEVKQGVRKDSDDIRRAKEVRKGMIDACMGGVALAISEIPFMNPGGYASANFNSGLVTGVLASCPVPLIQVFPKQVKMATVGLKNASKEEMIEWATVKFPNAPWLTRKLKGKVVHIAANEHLADAVATLYTGLRSEQFSQATALFCSQ